METSKRFSHLVFKQNILKNISVIIVTIVLIIWVMPYVKAVNGGITDVFLFLSIFPLGSMFGYFAFSYANTNLRTSSHRALADITTFVFLIIICFSVAFAAILGIVSIPELTLPFVVLATLLIAGTITYDFWDLYSNLSKDKTFSVKTKEGRGIKK